MRRVWSISELSKETSKNVRVNLRFRKNNLKIQSFVFLDELLLSSLPPTSNFLINFSVLRRKQLVQRNLLVFMLLLQFFFHHQTRFMFCFNFFFSFIFYSLRKRLRKHTKSRKKRPALKLQLCPIKLYWKAPLFSSQRNYARAHDAPTDLTAVECESIVWTEELNLKNRVFYAQTHTRNRMQFNVEKKWSQVLAVEKAKNTYI